MMLKQVIVVVMAVLITGCATHTSMQLPPSGTPMDNIYPGDRVDIQTQDGSHHEFTVEFIGRTGLAGDTQFVSYKDMTSVTVVTPPSEWKKWAWWGVIAATVIVLATANTDSGSESNLYEGWTDNVFICGFLFVCPD